MKTFSNWCSKLIHRDKKLNKGKLNEGKLNEEKLNEEKLNNEKLNEEINKEINKEKLNEELKVRSIRLTPKLTSNSRKKTSQPLKKYKLKYIIGKGSGGCVYKAIDIHENKMYAIKIIDLNERNIMDSIENEINIQNILHHNNIVFIKESFINNKDVTLWIVMEIAENGSLKDLLKHHYSLGIKDEIFIASILKQILIAIEYCHINKKIHRDIKSGNIMVDKNGVIKVGDFGLATTFNSLKRHNTFVGTLCWLAPEIIYNESYDEKIDIWSIGITVLELAFGLPPYYYDNPNQILHHLMNDDAPECKDYYKNEIHIKYIFSPLFEDFISKCLDKDPTHRSNASELLKHKFIDIAQDEVYINQRIKEMYAKESYDKEIKRDNERIKNEENNHSTIIEYI